MAIADHNRQIVRLCRAQSCTVERIRSASSSTVIPALEASNLLTAPDRTLPHAIRGLDDSIGVQHETVPFAQVCLVEL